MLVWVTAAVGVAVAMAAVECGLVSLVVPAAAGGAVPLAWPALMLGLHLLLSLVLALVLGALEPLTRRVRPPEAALVVALGIGAVVAWVLGEGIASLRPAVLTEFPSRVRLVHAALRLGAVGVGVGVTLLALPALRWVAGRSRTPLLRRVLPVLGLAAGGPSSLLLVYAGLAPIHLASASLAAGAFGTACLLVAARLALPTVSPRAGRVVAALALAVAVAGALGGRNPHARYVAFDHAAVAGRVAALVRDVTDLDRDGASSAWLLGADCAEFDAARGPTLREIRGDGVDQDCRGGDAGPRALTPPASPWPGCTPIDRPSSFLLVTVDALRADALVQSIMPEVTAFAARAIRFTRAYAPATSTQLSLPALFTGRWPTELSPGNLLVDARIVLPESLAARLGAAGRRTVGVDYFLIDESSRAGFAEWNPFPADPHPQTVKQAFATASMVQGALDFERRAGETPWLLWLHLPDPHAPYVIPADVGGGGRLAEKYSPYEFEAAYVDHHLGRLLAVLGERGTLDHTVVAVTADHGDSLGERGKEGHGADVYEEVIRVPLVLRVPGCPASVVDTPVSATALAPTLAALAGLAPGGRTLFPADLPADEAVVTESVRGPDDVLRRAVVVGTTKLVLDVRNGGAMLFDLASDPGETRDVLGLDGARDARMFAAYQRWLDSVAR